MPTTTKSIRRPTATLPLPKNVSALLTYAQNVVTRTTGNPALPAPTPPLALITTAINELQVAETAALARTKGAAAVRNEKRDALVSLLQQLRGHIQAAVDADAANGVSIIQSTGLAVRKIPTHHARVFAAKPGPVSGVAQIVAPSAGPRSSYEWQYSTDGGKTWVTAPVTVQAKTRIAGLVPGATVQFRYRAVTPKAGEGDWSQPVSLMIS